jgi:hypothetical protein
VTPGTLEINVEEESAESAASVRVGAGSTESNAERPPLFVAADEAFFWTREWQAGEAQAAREREAGDVVSFSSTHDLLAWLESDDE